MEKIFAPFCHKVSLLWQSIIISYSGFKKLKVCDLIILPHFSQKPLLLEATNNTLISAYLVDVCISRRRRRRRRRARLSGERI